MRLIASYGELMMLYYLFFFFKQKTAYEMRISDWSSDVCSSDLTGRWPTDEAESPDDERGSGREARALFSRLGFFCTGAAEVDDALISTTPKIGRASGRERVCQYV